MSTGWSALSLILKFRLVASGFSLEIGIMKDMEEPVRETEAGCIF